MNNILMIVGLPGSGKSYLANKIKEDSDIDYRIIDDPKNFDSDILPFISENLIITDPQLCFERNRKLAVDKISAINPKASIDFLFFENDPESCLQNSKKRDKSVESFIKNFSNQYTIPERSTTVSVYKNKKDDI